MKKGNCYETNSDLFTRQFCNHEGARLVHGLPTLQKPPFVKYGHCWIELDNEIVVDVSNGKFCVAPKGVYYRAGEIDEGECVKYTKADVYTNQQIHMHHGPWTDGHNRVIDEAFAACEVTTTGSLTPLPKETDMNATETAVLESRRDRCFNI